MASDDSTDGGSSDYPAGDPGDVPPYQPSTHDLAVESVWLRHRPPPLRRHPALPRASTIMLMAAFVAVLLLYLMLRPGG
ncbi:hypothetical protein ACLMAJ_23890 [Nocardia sp. KC 131]|jgi:hypothetical protein|uniref:hypothetical protein n=1 Tax=Nocardia arseniciresistens TaxID=3392119 RepID=UPI00398F6E47